MEELKNIEKNLRRERLLFHLRKREIKKNFSIAVWPDTLERIEELAKELSITKSQVAAALLDWALDEKEKEEHTNI